MLGHQEADSEMEITGSLLGMLLESIPVKEGEGRIEDWAEGCSVVTMEPWFTGHGAL